jgi:hypothetical protein
MQMKLHRVVCTLLLVEMGTFFSFVICRRPESLAVIVDHLWPSLKHYRPLVDHSSCYTFWEPIVDAEWSGSSVCNLRAKRHLGGRCCYQISRQARRALSAHGMAPQLCAERPWGAYGGRTATPMFQAALLPNDGECAETLCISQVYGLSVSLEASHIYSRSGRPFQHVSTVSLTTNNPNEVLCMVDARIPPSNVRGGTECCFR